jgi:membrane-bound ClpP family serine protease
MGLQNKILAFVIVGGLLLSILKQWVLLIVAGVILLFIIRWLADLFWKGKDNDWW